MSPYIVRRGEVHDGEKHYRCGEFVPGSKGSLADMEAVGAVEWMDAPVREPKAKPAAKIAAAYALFKAGGAKRKAVK